MRKVRIYNSLTNQIEVFRPREKGKVSMYVCGPTVYNYPHIGNMRPVVVFDTLRRFLSYIGYKVTYVSNYTDVDDKIINAAKKENKSEKELTEFYINEFQKTIKAIGCQIPSITPKVTEYIQKIIEYIAELVKLGAAYEVDGDVYFRVSKIKDYGSLSGVRVDELVAGARVEENSKKESSLDFALWKKTESGIKWDSPWGKGRPGWHTECCVMIDTIFDRQMIDIHGGGYDLKFPHHENEIAQAKAMNGNKIANYWMHNAFININNEKMSKSLGNVIYAKDLVKEYGGAVVRLVILNAHYRQPVNFTDETLIEAAQEAKKINSAMKMAALKLKSNGIKPYNKPPIGLMDSFLDSLADDLNTANALGCLYSLLKDMNQMLRNRDCPLDVLCNEYKAANMMLYVLGLGGLRPKAFDKKAENLYRLYDNAKMNKDFEKSDIIRQKLIAKGIM